jgi:hypothetical protein
MKTIDTAILENLPPLAKGAYAADAAADAAYAARAAASWDTIGQQASDLIKRMLGPAETEANHAN